jgi:hypothetical protein
MKAKEILYDVISVLDNDRLYRPEVIKSILTVLDVYEPDLLDDTVIDSSLIASKYGAILKFLKESVFNERKQTYDMLAMTDNMGSKIVYSVDLIYNNYIINDVTSIVNVLDNDNIKKLVLDEEATDNLVKDRVVVDYNRIKYKLKTAYDNALSEIHAWDYVSELGIYEDFDIIKDNANKYFDSSSTIDMLPDGSVIYKLSEDDCARVALFSNMCYDMGIRPAWIEAIPEDSIDVVNHKHRVPLFMHYLEAMECEEFKDIIFEVIKKGE